MKKIDINLVLLVLFIQLILGIIFEFSLGLGFYSIFGGISMFIYLLIKDLGKK